MAILQEDVERVRQASDIVDVIGQHMALKRVGRRWAGLCPFHGEKTASFSVNQDIGRYYCFGCQVKGDVFNFVMEIEHVTFVDAVERLASKANIELRHDTTNAGQDRKHRAALSEAMQRAVDWYHQRLLTGNDARAARSYLRDRGYDGDLVRSFKIGWAPDSWDELARSLKLPAEVLKETGLGFVNRRGRMQDAFRGRILFPIFDSSGSPVAFGGRIMPGVEGPKYKNSAETPLYAKSRTLYALNWAKQDVVKTGEVVVCEGYTDVIAFFQVGLPRAVATCGTALTEDHVRQLKNFATRIVLAYDADKAGQAAVERFYQWEKDLAVDIVVALFPPGSDPADAAGRDPALLTQAVKEARPFLAFRIERALESADLRTVEGRARAAERCVAMIAEHPNELVRDQYLMTVADRCRVAIESLREALNNGGLATALASAPPSVVDLRVTRRSEETASRTEWEALRVAVHRPEALAELFDTILPSTGFRGVEDVLFADPRARAAFAALVESPTLHDALTNAEPEAAELLSRLAVEAENEEGGPGEFLRLIDQAAGRSIRELEVQVRVVADGFARVGPVISWLKLTVEQLRAPTTATDAAGALLGWLVEQQKKDEQL